MSSQSAGRIKNLTQLCLEVYTLAERQYKQTMDANKAQYIVSEIFIIRRELAYNYFRLEHLADITEDQLSNPQNSQLLNAISIPNIADTIRLKLLKQCEFQEDDGYLVLLTGQQSSAHTEVQNAIEFIRTKFFQYPKYITFMQSQRAKAAQVTNADMTRDVGISAAHDNALLVERFLDTRGILLWYIRCHVLQPAGERNAQLIETFCQGFIQQPDRDILNFFLYEGFRLFEERGLLVLDHYLSVMAIRQAQITVMQPVPVAPPAVVVGGVVQLQDQNFKLHILTEISNQLMQRFLIPNRNGLVHIPVYGVVGRICKKQSRNFTAFSQELGDAVTPVMNLCLQWEEWISGPDFDGSTLASTVNRLAYLIIHLFKTGGCSVAVLSSLSNDTKGKLNGITRIIKDYIITETDIIPFLTDDNFYHVLAHTTWKVVLYFIMKKVHDLHINGMLPQNQNSAVPYSIPPGINQYIGDIGNESNTNTDTERKQVYKIIKKQLAADMQNALAIRNTFPGSARISTAAVRNRSGATSNIFQYPPAGRPAGGQP